MKTFLILFSILFVCLSIDSSYAEPDTNFYLCKNDNRVTRKISKRINQELRCLDEETVKRDFNKIYELIVHPDKRRITIIRDRNNNSLDYKEKLFLEHSYNYAVSGKSDRKNLVTFWLADNLRPIARIACTKAFSEVNGYEMSSISIFDPKFINVTSQQLDNPIIDKDRMIYDFKYSSLTHKIYDFQSTFECRTKEEAKNERIRAKEERKKLEQEKIARLKKEEEEKKELLRLEALENKKSLCREIGAEDNSSEMIMCVTRLMEIEKMSEIAEDNKQQSIANRNQVLNEIARTNEQIRKDEQARRQGQALMNLGAAISGGGTIGSPSSTPSRTSAPPVSQPRYSKTLTVDSNKNCPILIDALVKQEVIGLNRICYYR